MSDAHDQMEDLPDYSVDALWRRFAEAVARITADGKPA